MNSKICEFRIDTYMNKGVLTLKEEHELMKLKEIRRQFKKEENKETMEEDQKNIQVPVAPVANDGWNKHDGQIWDPKAGESIEGIYLGKQDDVGANKSKLYKMDSNGKIIEFWGSTVLDGKMIGVRIEQMLKVLFEGLKKPEGKKEYKSYEIYTKSLVN